MEERLQKILARAGFGSRRAAEELIEAGRVRVNSQVAVLGSKADPTRDRITVDGRQIASSEPLTYIIIYKPRNVLSTVSAPDDRQTVRDLVPVPGHLYPVGRLDFDSEGLILLTNDGELANRLTHPRYGHEKEYRVLVAIQPDEQQLDAWRRGLVLEDGYKTQPAKVRYESASGKGAWLRVVLNEGRKRQIREMGKLTGLPVVRIIRVRLGSIQLGKLQPREWRHLTEKEVAALRSSNAPAKPIKRSRR
jgi:23S rRNA pseudouridine2605 synthase